MKQATFAFATLAVADALQMDVAHQDVAYHSAGIEANESKYDAMMCAEHTLNIEDVWQCEEAPWRPFPTEQADLCIEGKAVPKLYVLGAQKTSTSSFANDLACAGVAPVPSTSGNFKEFGFFIARAQWNGANDEERSRWLKNMPECNEKSTRLVADMTPNNLRMVEGELPYGPVFIDVPGTLRTFYGKAASQAVTFVAMIRNPLSRMQSAWYAARLCSNHAICTMDCRGDSFKADLKVAVQNAKQSPPVFTEWIWTSMYNRHLQEWTKHFDASQFYVIPYKQYSDGEKDGICESLARRTGFPMDCESKGALSSHAWNNEHPSLDADIPNWLQAEFENVMDPEIDQLVKLMAQGQRSGMGLANYHGDGSHDDVKEWLKNWW